MPSTPTQGTPMQPSRNVAARAGRWSAQHRKTALLGWIAFVVLAFVVGGKLGTNTLTNVESGVGESGRADRIVAGAYPDRVEEMVLVQSSTLKVDDPAFRAAVGDVTTRLRKVDGVTAITTPYGKHAQGAVSPKRDAALVSFQIPGDPAEDDAVQGVGRCDRRCRGRRRRGAPGPAHRAVGLGLERGRRSSRSSRPTCRRPARPRCRSRCIILLVAFGALVAAGIPLLLAITAVVATMGLVGPLSQLAPVDESIKEVILLIGLAVGVDYSLFYLRRVREERAAGRSNEAAIEAAAATSGRAVLISGITVMIAMAGMYFGGAATFTSFATGTIVVVAVAMLGSLTVLPAILSLARRQGRQGARPRPRSPEAPDGVARAVVAHRGRRHAPPAAVGRRVGGAAARDGRAGAAHEHRHARHRHAAAGARRRAEVRAPAGGVPERDLVAQRRRQGEGRHRSGRDARRRAARAGDAAQRRRCSPARGRSSRTSAPTRR